MTPRDKERAALFAGTYIPREAIMDEIILQEEIASMPEWREADHGMGLVRDGKIDAIERAKRSVMEARCRFASLITLRNEIDRMTDQAKSDLNNARICLVQAEKSHAA